MLTNWPVPCYTTTRQWEGGNDDDKRDSGGRTSRGITQREYNVYRETHPGLPADVWGAPESAIADIYRGYWNAACGDIWPSGLDLSVWDAAVNSGPGRARQWAKGAIGSELPSFASLANYAKSLQDKVPAIQKYNSLRLSFLHALRTWSIFGGGWGKRVSGIEAKSVKMALEEAKLPAPEVKKRLETESGNAKADAKKHGTGAAGTGTAGGGTATQVDWSNLDWSHYLLIGGLGLAVVLIIAFFIWWTYQHNQRANAYQQAAAAI